MSALYLQRSVLTPTEFIEKEFEDNPVDTLFNPNKIINFIEVLYEKLKENEICFLSGSFVFEDPNLKLYYTLCGFDKTGNTKLNLTRAGPFTSTHSVFFRNENFKNLRSISNNIYLDDDFNEKVNTIKILGKQIDLQYQRNIKNPLEYLCDTCCQKKTRNENVCSNKYCDNNKEAKGAILFYPFRTIEKIDDAGNTRVKTYLFLKLEGFEALSIMHSIAAIKRYILEVEKKQAHEVRREDDKESKPKKKGFLKKTLKIMKKPFKRTKKNTMSVLTPHIQIPNQTKFEKPKKTKKNKTHKTNRLPLTKSNIIHMNMRKKNISNENMNVLTTHVNAMLNEKNTRYLSYNDELLEKDNHFINNILEDSSIETKNEAMKNFKYYNENIRSSKELFIPKEVTQKIASEIIDSISDETNMNNSNHNIINLDDTLTLEENEQLDEIPFIFQVQRVLSEQTGVQLSTSHRELSVALGISTDHSVDATPIGTAMGTPIGTSAIHNHLQTPIPLHIQHTSTPMSRTGYKLSRSLEKHFNNFEPLPRLFSPYPGIRITNTNENTTNV